MNTCILRHAYLPDDPRERKFVNALLEAAYKVDLICLRKKGQPFFENYNGARIYRIPLSHKRSGIIRYFLEYALSFFMMSILLTLLFFINRYKCIQVPTMPDFLIFTTMIPKFFRTKIILDIHEPTPELWITKYGREKLQWLLSLQIQIEQMAIKYSDLTLTVTEALRERLAQRGAKIKKIIVIPNVCNEKEFNVGNCGQVLRDKKFKIVTHGLIEQRYGHDLAVRAVHKLSHKMPEIQYDIIGFGEDTDSINKLINDLKCSHQVRLNGFLPFNEMLQKLRVSDIGIIAMHSSPYSELIDTNKMYELIALRIPVVVSRLPVVESIFDDSCLMFFDPGDEEDLAQCILELYRNPQKRTQLAVNAYKRYEKMCWANTKNIYLRKIKSFSE